MKLLSHVRLCANPWTAAHQAPPFMGFSRQEHWNAIAFSTSQSGLPYGSNDKESACNAGDLDLIPAEGNGYPLQCSCLENCMDREAWWTAVHGVAWTEKPGGLRSMGLKSQTLPLSPQSGLFLRLSLSFLMALVCPLQSKHIIAVLFPLFLLPGVSPLQTYRWPTGTRKDAQPH